MKIIIFVLLIIILLMICASYKLYDLALNAKSSKEILFGSGDNQTPRKEDRWIYEYDKKEDVYINSFDNLRLHGYRVRNNSHKWAITVHGYTNEAGFMSAMAYKYFSMGYNLIMPDLRGHGESEGDYIGMGWHDRLDIMKWIDFIVKEDREAEILLHGVSMGAATVMMVSGEKLPPNVKVIIEDCGYTTAREEFSGKLKSMFKLPAFPFMNICNIICKIKSNYYIFDASAIDQIKKSTVPILFIHGDRDNFVPFYMMDKLYEACNSEKDKVIIEGAGHAKSEKVNTALYWDRVVEFIDKYI